MRGFPKLKREAILLDLTFFVINVLACNGIVFFHNHFFGHGPRVLFGHVEMACTRGRVKTDLDRGWLSHFVISCVAARTFGARA